MRVVLDTNILVSALLWRGAPYRCLLAVQAGLADLVISPPILEELRTVLVTKFRHTARDADEAIGLIQAAADVVEISGQLRVVPDDPDDDKFVETAHAVAPLRDALAPSTELPPVWPDPAGEVRGLAFSPLYSSAPRAARRDKTLYALLALVDAVRGGRARERKIALRMLDERLQAYGAEG